ncbi:ABC transporter ATP-binding protein [Fulvivirga sp. RKSG066]|uniref:ABC transporter ATP-binding protein n=1 Tax=Fulvivirga aurantia TaxID=2529383 RepID=UPI0012BC0228|nr:ABC transporter ATP-binding protein [Fulvivirga aurantia]MTI20521.1 ABC transporter ATP-binding protein [Fulvivirga aurantia]
MSLLQIKGVSKTFDGERLALKEIQLEVEKLKRVGIVGGTGSGKSTLLKIIAGLEQASSGELYYKKEKIPGPNDQLVAGHKKIKYLSQYFELPKFITVEDFIYSPYRISEDDVEKLYKACHIKHLIDQDTRELSGGERQRVSLAKLLVEDPEVLLLDEPFSNLDMNHQATIKNVIENVERDLGTTIIMVSHDPSDVLAWADQILVMYEGEIIQTSAPYDVYNYPINEYVAGLFGTYNLIDKASWKLQNKKLTQVNEKVIVRPEMFKLHFNGESMKKGKVTKVNYYGSHEELEVKIGDQSIKVRSGVGEYAVGDEVSLEV